MPGLILYTGNRLEQLMEALAAVTGKSRNDPLTTETIVVQSKGMERWISLELARRHGICANVAFPFPSRFVASLYGLLFPSDMEDHEAYEPSALTWGIMGLLPTLLEEPGFEDLRGYLYGMEGEIRLCQLAAKIASLFDAYLVFRPDMVLGWDAGREGHWQARLWRRLVATRSNGHPAARWNAFFERLRTGPRRGLIFPERVSIFGISTLPPLFVRILAAVAPFMEIHLFVLNPCREYWGDIVSDREMGRLLDRGVGQDGATPTAEELYLVQGNSLLASLGGQGRDFLETVHQIDLLEEIPLFVDPGPETLLSVVQADILDLRHRSFSGLEAERLLKDGSMEVHNCHSPMREMEVLQDRLLYHFEQDPSLKPSDILVMTPDIDRYAPFVSAVFTLPREDGRWIPFRIADRGLRRENPLADGLFRLLDLTTGRFEASQVFDFLQCPALNRTLAFSDDELSLVQELIESAGIRWGIDGTARAALGLPADGTNTWREGLERLLLGYALPEGDGRQLFMGRLPCDSAAEADEPTLERFFLFMDRLFSIAADLAVPRSPTRWSETLGEIFSLFFAVQDEAFAIHAQAIREGLNALADTARNGQFHGKVGLATVRLRLEELIRTNPWGSGFLTGGVTFGAMLPMRSIPFRMVCLVGMDDDAYPRRPPRLGFDLMARSPRPGDPDRRRDDRYLFLEALLSARQTLYISFVGQSGDDKTIRPPSALVSELLDCCAATCGLPGEDLWERLVRTHALHGFDFRYFQPENPTTSYAPELCQAARAAGSAGLPPRSFFTAGLPPPEEREHHLHLNDLETFFANPARYLLVHRLGLHMRDNPLALEDSEPFVLHGLDRYRLRLALTVPAIAGVRPETLQEALKASGRLPHGTPGQYTFQRLRQETECLLDRLTPLTASPLPPLPVEIALSGWRLSGRLEGRFSSGLVIFRPTSLKAGDFLQAWIRHLVYQLTGDHPGERRTYLVFDDGVRCFQPLPHGAERLDELFNLYRAGLTKPLPFFKKSSFAYARSLSLDKTKGEALRSAEGVWRGERFPEGADPAYRLCFDPPDPLDEAFQSVALTVYSPLLACLEAIA